MIPRHKAWAPALAAVAAILVGGAVWLRGAMLETVARETSAISYEHLVEEFDHMLELSRASERMSSVPTPVEPAERERLTAIGLQIHDWHVAVETGVAEDEVSYAIPQNRGQQAAFAYALSRNLEVAQGIMMRHPHALEYEARRMSEEIAAAMPAARIAAAQARVVADRARINLQRWMAGWCALALAGLGATGVFVIRPLAIDWVRRGEQLQELERRMMHNARHDPLTGLPNRRYLSEHTARVLAAAGRGGRIVAALHLNLDRFKAVNDTLGMGFGDKLLRRAAGILRAETRRGDFVARIGSDEFVVVISEVLSLEDLVNMAARLIERLSEPMILDGEEIRVGACVGIAMAEPERLTVDRLLTNADLALFDAKSGGRGRYAFFTDNRRAEFENRRRIAAELREAIALNQLEPFFQPQVCARTGRPIGFEALVRWRHPERGLLSPFHFLGEAQETGLIDQIGEIVTRKALSALAIWRSMGLPAEKIGLNVSARELRDSAFVDKLAWDVDAAGLEPRHVGIEILESVLIDHDDDPVIRNVAALSSAGFSVELDDFGTGHASIANLKKFRVNKIKIDRSFVTDIDTQPEQQKITRAMINLAHSLDVEALVEGVETVSEMRRLRAMGCDAVQGYLIGRPMAEADALLWLQRRLEGPPSAWSGVTADPQLLSGGLGV